MNVASSPRLMAALAFAATFAAGAASMRAVDVMLLRSRTPVARGWSEAADKLQLTPTQRQQVDQVFARFQPSSDAVLTSLAPRLAAVSDSMQRSIDSLLSPRQRVQLRGLQRPATYLIRRKSMGSSRVDTLRIP